MLAKKIATRLKEMTDSRYRQFYYQRRFRDVSARESKANAIAAQLPDFPGREQAALEDAARNLKEQGYVPVSDVVRPEWIPEMVAFFSDHECADPYRPEHGRFKAPANVPGGTHVAWFDHEVVVRAPHAFEIANHPAILGIVSRMLGAKPTISYMTAWWSVPAGDGKAEQAENFHRDVDDWRFVKLFVYLTEVDETAGPHMFVRGSHRMNKLTEIRRFTDDEVTSAFGADSIMRFTGTAGTTFLENTYGFHRGTPPTKKPRLIYQVLYSLRPNVYGPKNPIVRLGANGVPADIDPYINRVYCAR